MNMLQLINDGANKLKNRNIDLIASGINHGSNSSISVLYSGTMSAAIEGAIENTPAIGFSLCDFDPNAYLDHSKEYIKVITKNAIENPNLINVVF